MPAIAMVAYNKLTVGMGFMKHYTLPVGSVTYSLLRATLPGDPHMQLNGYC